MDPLPCAVIAEPEKTEEPTVRWFSWVPATRPDAGGGADA